MTGIELIEKERKEQIEKHGILLEDDVNHNADGQLLSAARKLLAHEQLSDVILYNPPHNWGRVAWIRMCRKSYKDRLIIAGALIAAELDRINTK